MNNLQKKKFDSNFDLNKFFRGIRLKKQYIKTLKNKIVSVNDLKVKNYKKVSFMSPSLKKSDSLLKEDFLIKYIIDVTFSRTNTFVHVMDFSGQLKFFCSAGTLNYKGKSKKARYSVFRDIYRVLVS